MVEERPFQQLEAFMNQQATETFMTSNNKKTQYYRNFALQMSRHTPVPNPKDANFRAFQQGTTVYSQTSSQVRRTAGSQISRKQKD